MVHVSGGRGFVWGFREELSSGLSQPGGEAVEQSGGAPEPMLQNRLPDGRSWMRLWEG